MVLPLEKSIKQITVDKLFGRYTYVLPAPDSLKRVDKFFILYGDNGSGKTTILRLLYHLLATERGRGHKTAIAAIPFSRFEIKLANGTTIWISRERYNSFVGEYELGFKKTDSEAEIFPIPIDERGIVSIEDDSTSLLGKFLDRVKSLDFMPIMLSDDRTILIDDIGRKLGRFPSLRDEILEYKYSNQIYRPDENVSAEMIVIGLVNRSIRRANLAIRDQYVQAATKGEGDINRLYLDLLSRLVKPSSGEQNNYSLHELTDRLGEIEGKSREYSKFGLFRLPNTKEIRDTLKLIEPDKEDMMVALIQPFVESLETKLNALEKVFQQIGTFTSILDSFFSPKKISFQLRQGLKIFAEDGKELNPELLSSGERQILLMLCNTLLALHRPSIYIIDEPELSLNIKWQRIILDSLEKLTIDKPVQYIFATHSMEILSEHDEYVVDLKTIQG